MRTIDWQSPVLAGAVLSPTPPSVFVAYEPAVELHEPVPKMRPQQGRVPIPIEHVRDVLRSRIPVGIKRRFRDVLNVRTCLRHRTLAALPTWKEFRMTREKSRHGSPSLWVERIA